MAYDSRGVGPLKITEKSYNKQNRKMRKENPTMGSKLTSGTSPRRVSFACRFGGMKGPMKEKNGEPTSKALALKKWGFGSVEAANAFVEHIENHNMKGVKHYTEDGEYKGETHKMDGKVHTGAKHGEASKVVSHKPGGPFKMNKSPFHKSKGLWANIHAKRKRGETMRKKGDAGAPSEQDLKDSQ